MAVLLDGRWDLYEALDALLAFRAGATDSGVKDARLERAVTEHLRNLEDDDFRETCARFARSYLTEEKIRLGYGLPEVQSFISWLENHDLSL